MTVNRGLTRFTLRAILVPLLAVLAGCVAPAAPNRSTPPPAPQQAEPANPAGDYAPGGVFGTRHSEIGRKANAGRFSEIVDLVGTDTDKYATLALYDHRKVCEALLSMRRLGPVLECVGLLAQRADANGGRIPGRIYRQTTDHGEAWSGAILGLMLAQAYQFQGDFVKARDYAKDVLSVTADLENFQFPEMVAYEDEPLQKFRNAISFGLRSAVQEGERKALGEQYRTDMMIAAVGVAGVSAARTGQDAAARDAVAQLAAIDTGGFFTRAADEERRAQQARILFALRDYEASIAVMEQVGKLGVGGALQELFSLTGKVNPFSVLYAGETGVLTVSQMEFAAGVEPRLMLHRAQLETGRLQGARKGFDSLLREKYIGSFGNALYFALHGRGRVALSEGDTDAALDYFRRAIEVIEEQRSAIRSETYKMAFVGDKQEVYRDMVNTLVRVGRAGDAFEYAERGKARALVDMLAGRELSPGRELDAGQAAALLRELEAAEDASWKSAGFSVAAAGSGGNRSVRSVRDRIRAQAPEFASLVSVTTPGLAKIQSRLGANESLLEYFYVGDDGVLLAFVVTRDQVRAFPLEGRGLVREVRRLRRAISEPGGGHWESRSRKLYQRLLEPVAGVLDQRNLVIVPHGILHYVPFAALQAADGRALLDRHAIRMLPSASVLQFIGDRVSGTRQALVLGNPDLGDASRDLPGAEAEARAIASVVPGATVLLRDSASETLLKKAGSQFGYLHLASHGEFNPAEPLASRLLLAPDDANDGNLTVGEIYDLDLRADLVTLSACETGLGDITGGDDVVGLSRGFLYAGSESIVSSLWPVADEATRHLMQAFYENLGRSGKRDALRLAQMATREKYPHPAHWSAFQLTGAP